MGHDYQNVISHIDLDRSLNSIEFFHFHSMDDAKILEFREDIEGHNDSIELHLVKSKSYKEALVLQLKGSDNSNNHVWKELLREDQKTFGGSKIFYMNPECTKMLVLSVENEIKNKLNMVITRVNKVNEKINRMNTKIKKDNLELYVSRLKSKEAASKEKDDIINFINENLRV